MNLKLRLFGPEKLILLIMVLMIVVRVGYLHVYDSASEVKFGQFNLQDHFVYQFNYYFLSLLYVVLQIKLCVDFSYSKVSRAARNNSFLYFAVFIFVVVKLINPAQYYVDMFIPIFFLIYVGISKELRSSNKVKLGFWVLLINSRGFYSSSSTRYHLPFLYKYAQC